MIRNLFVALALVASGTFASVSIARAGEEAPAAAPAPETAKPAAEAPKTQTKTEAPATKTPSPMHTLMGFVAKQVAPNLECGCPSKPEGEKAWRAWFAGGKDVPMAGLRDQLVADGWNADTFVGFFKAMASKKCAEGCKDGGCKDGGCKDGGCKDGEKGCCEGKGERADGKPCCGKCKEGAKKDAPATPSTAAPEKPAEPAPSKP